MAIPLLKTCHCVLIESPPDELSEHFQCSRLSGECVWAFDGKAPVQQTVWRVCLSLWMQSPSPLRDMSYINTRVRWWVQGPCRYCHGQHAGMQAVCTQLLGSAVHSQCCRVQVCSLLKLVPNWTASVITNLLPLCGPAFVLLWSPRWSHSWGMRYGVSQVPENRINFSTILCEGEL